MTEQPVWEFDKVEITYLQSIMKKGKKSKTRCLASIDFGFFIIMDIGITLERRYENRLTWSNRFGWSEFRFGLTKINNPYCKEVTKLAHMIKEELDKKKSVIINFLNDPSTAPKIIHGE